MKKKIKPTMTELADAAFEQMAAKVIEIAKNTKTPIIIWENGKVKKVQPKTMAARLSAKRNKRKKT